MQKIASAGFAWDKANHSKCQKHGVSVAEVEHVLAHAATLIVPDIKNSRAEQRFLAIGRTEAGRYTLVVFTPRQTGGGILMRPISARYMHRKEIEKYEQEIARVQNR
ncbi:MAG: BrnT family toxin [Candidatus Binatus sp.]